MPRKKNAAAGYAGTEEFEKIRSSLLNAVGGEESGAHSIDLVNAYMDLWCQRQLLRDDIHTRGVYIVYDNGGGQKGTKRNDSIQDELKVTAQMLNIRSALGIKEAGGGGSIEL